MMIGDLVKLSPVWSHIELCYDHTFWKHADDLFSNEVGLVLEVGRYHTIEEDEYECHVKVLSPRGKVGWTRFNLLKVLR